MSIRTQVNRAADVLRHGSEKDTEVHVHEHKGLKALARTALVVVAASAVVGVCYASSGDGKTGSATPTTIVVPAPTSTTTTTTASPATSTTEPPTTLPPTTTTTLPPTTTTAPPPTTTPTIPQQVLPASGVAGPWTLVFNDEFGGSSLNTSNWSYCMSDGSCYNQYNVLQFRNQEYAVPQNCIVDNGLDLKVTAGNPHPKHPYNSCIIQTHGKFDFTYGYVEAKIYFPEGNDSWPAFWMLPSNAVVPPEIDIAEQIGANTAPEENYYYANGAAGFGGYHVGRYTVTNPSGSFNTYAVNWEPGSITFYVNGQETGNYTSSTVTSEPMYLILTLAIDSLYPNPQVPQNMYVQDVRVWQHTPDYTR